MWMFLGELIEGRMWSIDAADRLIFLALEMYFNGKLT
jgi:hypothetical protein